MIPYSNPVTGVRALYENKLLWSALDIAGSLVVAKRTINVSLIGEGSVRYDLDTVTPPHIVW